MYKLSEAAARDIEIIFERSISDFGLPQTELYFNSLKTCLELLSRNPYMGNIIDDIPAAYRRFAHQSHEIFYEIFENEILIVRVLHKSMDIDKYINK